MAKRIKIDEDAVKRAAAPQMQGFERDVNAIRVSKRGRPVGEVEQALKQAAKKHGVEPGPGVLTMAKEISES